MRDIDQQLATTLHDQLLIHDEFEARYWARVLGVTRAQVLECLGSGQTSNSEPWASLEARWHRHNSSRYGATVNAVEPMSKPKR